MSKTIAFIGGGNMATSIIGGLIASGTSSDSIIVADPSEGQLAIARETHGVRVTNENQEAASVADVIVLAVKPHLIETVCESIKATIRPSTLIVSIAAGITEKAIARWMGTKSAIVRCMPNTPALLGLGASALYANPHCDSSDKTLAESLLKAVGLTVWVEEESLLDTVTSLSGSGPAYFFYLIECMTNSAIEQGLDAETAENLAIETAFGAASMARSRKETPAKLRENVTSKGGTTAAALTSFASNDFPATISKGMQAAENRAKEMGQEFGNS